MAIYRTISISFWTDSKVSDDFTPEDRYFYLYLFTNPHTNLAGCYEISIKQMSNETGYSKDTIERLIDRFKKIHQIIDYSKETKEVLLLNWHKYNWTKSEKFRKPLAYEINNIKDDIFKEYLSKIFNGIDVRYRIDTNYIDTNCIDTSVTVTDTDTVTDTNTVSDYINNKEINKKKFKVFVPPTFEEVRDYCLERRNSIDPETFIDFYESKGWMVGKNKMKDWKACIRTWEKHDKGNSKTQYRSEYMETIKNRVNVVDDWV